MVRKFDCWNDPDALRAAVSNSPSMAESLRRLGFAESTATSNWHRKKLLAACQEYGIPMSYPPQVPWNRLSDEVVFVKNSPLSRGSLGTLKRRAIALGYVTENCECGQPPEWMGKPLTIQLDHFNGDPTDNRPENLRMLCPNCHTQTPTYGSKKRVSQQERGVLSMSAEGTSVFSGHVVE